MSLRIFLHLPKLFIVWNVINTLFIITPSRKRFLTPYDANGSYCEQNTWRWDLCKMSNFSCRLGTRFHRASEKIFSYSTLCVFVCLCNVWGMVVKKCVHACVCMSVFVCMSINECVCSCECAWFYVCVCVRLLDNANNSPCVSNALRCNFPSDRIKEETKRNRYNLITKARLSLTHCVVPCCKDQTIFR